MELGDSKVKLLSNSSHERRLNAHAHPGVSQYALSNEASKTNIIEDVIRLNVGGSIFMTMKANLDRIPGTRLSNLTYTDPNFNKETNEWFFDRNPQLFNYILDFYRTDELHFPHNFCGPSIKKELLYWRIEEGDIHPCCWNRYNEFEEEKKIFQRIERAFESKSINEALAGTGNTSSKWQIWRRKISIFLEEPMSSKPAKIWAVVFLLFVLASIGVLCIETHPKLRVPSPHGLTVPTNVSNFTSSDITVTPPTPFLTAEQQREKRENPKMYYTFHTQPLQELEVLDTICTYFFTIEFLIRFIVAPNRSNFVKSPMNVIDVLCVLPMWIRNLMHYYEIRINKPLLPVFFLLTILRVLRICRVLRMARHYTGVKILLLALKASLRELGMLLFFVFIVVLIFAVVVYYAEFFEADTFDNIPEGWWWAIITITTVGYGDMHPKSGLGYVVGALCAITGILATGLPVPIIANNFNLYYKHAQLKEAVSNRRNSSQTHPSLSSKSKDDSTTMDAYVIKEEVM